MMVMSMLPGFPIMPSEGFDSVNVPRTSGSGTLSSGTITTVMISFTPSGNVIWFDGNRLPVELLMPVDMTEESQECEKMCKSAPLNKNVVSAFQVTCKQLSFSLEDS